MAKHNCLDYTDRGHPHYSYINKQQKTLLTATRHMTAVTKLMLVLAQVNAFRSSHYQTLIKHSTVHRKQVEYDDSLLWQIQVFVQ